MHAGVGDQNRDVLLGQCFEIGFRVILGICGIKGVWGGYLPGGLGDRQQQLQLQLRAVGLCLNDDLMMTVDGGVALAFAGDWLGAVRVDTVVALAGRLLTALPVVGMVNPAEDGRGNFSLGDASLSLRRGSSRIVR